MPDQSRQHGGSLKSFAAILRVRNVERVKVVAEGIVWSVAAKDPDCEEAFESIFVVA